MNTPPKTKTSFAKRKPRLFLSIVAAGLAVVLALIWMVFNYFSNYAEKTAKPLEAALLKAGAVKKCSTGDAGRGTDNNQPWYNVYYELAANRDKATTTVKEIAASNGYKLTQASTSRGPVQVDDAYVNNWLYNTMDKKSSFDDLQAGNIELFFTVDNDGPVNLSCDSGTKTATINAGTNISMIGIRTKLPEFKR